MDWFREESEKPPGTTIKNSMTASQRVLTIGNRDLDQSRDSLPLTRSLRRDCGILAKPDLEPVAEQLHAITAVRHTCPQSSLRSTMSCFLQERMSQRVRCCLRFSLLNTARTQQPSKPISPLASARLKLRKYHERSLFSSPISPSKQGQSQQQTSRRIFSTSPLLAYSKTTSESLLSPQSNTNGNGNGNGNANGNRNRNIEASLGLASKADRNPKCNHQQEQQQILKKDEHEYKDNKEPLHIGTQIESRASKIQAGRLWQLLHRQSYGRKSIPTVGTTSSAVNIMASSLASTAIWI